ncbi:hypothetical protein KI387_007009, partial [Taxus chinensis]
MSICLLLVFDSGDFGHTLARLGSQNGNGGFSTFSFTHGERELKCPHACVSLVWRGIKDWEAEVSKMEVEAFQECWIEESASF